MPVPVEIRLQKHARRLVIAFDDGAEFALSCEYLRVYSPSAEVRGHGQGQATLQIGKEHVNITQIEPVGNYAVRLIFDDGHRTGLYTWDYLYQLGTDCDRNWQSYVEDLAAAGHEREQGR